MDVLISKFTSIGGVWLLDGLKLASLTRKKHFWNKEESFSKVQNQKIMTHGSRCALETVFTRCLRINTWSLELPLEWRSMKLTFIRCSNHLCRIKKSKSEWLKSNKKLKRVTFQLLKRKLYQCIIQFSEKTRDWWHVIIVLKFIKNYMRLGWFIWKT